MPFYGAAAGGSVPAGGLLQYGGAAAPEGWLLCDGAAVSRATFADLFAALGTAYGAGDGSTFNVPDLRQRFPLGKAAAGTGAALGATGGTIDSSPTHTVHTVGISPDHFVTAAGTDSYGTHGAHPVYNPPFVTVNYIVKT